jgi:hypothetical protein
LLARIRQGPAAVTRPWRAFGARAPRQLPGRLLSRAHTLRAELELFGHELELRRHAFYFFTAHAPEVLLALDAAGFPGGVGGATRHLVAAR